MDAASFLCCVEAIKCGDAAVQEDAANQTASLRDPLMLSEIQRYVSDESALVRRVMLWTLRNYTSQISYPPLLPCLLDSDMAVREAALLLFMEGGSPAVDALVAAVSSCDERVQFSAVEALGQFRTPEAVVPLMGAAAVAVLGEHVPAWCADDASAVVRRAVASVVVSSEVLGRLCRDTDPSVRMAAAEAVGKRRYPMEDVLLPLLSDEVPGVRRAAVTGIDFSERADVVPALIGCLSDPKPGVQAATALGEIGGDEVVAALSAASESGNVILRGIVRNALNAARKRSQVSV